MKLYRTGHRHSLANPQEKHDVMSLFDALIEAANEAAAHDLRLGQALGVVRAYGESLDRSRHEPGYVSDAAELPYPKETIKWALLLFLAALRDPAQRESLKAAYVALAEWQSPADFETAAFDSMRLRKKMDPLALAKEFASRATPRSRWIEASRAEQQVLIAELKRKGFW